MFSHVTLGTDNWPRSKRFYDAIMQTLDIPVFLEREEGAAFGEMIGPKLFVGPAFNGAPATSGNGTHVAFLAKNPRRGLTPPIYRLRKPGIVAKTRPFP